MMGIKIVVRKARESFKRDEYPLEVVAMDGEKVVSQPTLVRNRRDGLVFGNGMVAAYMSVDRVTGMVWENHNVEYDPDCEGIE